MLFVPKIANCFANCYLYCQLLFVLPIVLCTADSKLQFAIYSLPSADCTVCLVCSLMLDVMLFYLLAEQSCECRYFIGYLELFPYMVKGLQPTHTTHTLSTIIAFINFALHRNPMSTE